MGRGVEDWTREEGSQVSVGNLSYPLPLSPLPPPPFFSFVSGSCPLFIFIIIFFFLLINDVIKNEVGNAVFEGGDVEVEVVKTHNASQLVVTRLYEGCEWCEML